MKGWGGDSYTVLLSDFGFGFGVVWFGISSSKTREEWRALLGNVSMRASKAPKNKVLEEELSISFKRHSHRDP